ncbi:membrane-spanning 4-domains subfamily A member 12 [Lepus europaeus]|uniref:membrane-spanning 4-domains subfamily A member 12 n=1 Tax=Lepus europaeus TaxID=9983 RepID=UPI002B47AF11|nr:membrane-spanning 4-domains subfamily A member 12 [Lepus europaeus]
MMSSNPTSYSGGSETIRTPYPLSSCTVPGSPQPQGLINLGNQAQGGQLPFITAPGILDTHQLGQGNMQVINSAIGKAAIKFKEEAKGLGAIQVMIGIMHIGFGIILGLLSYSTENYWDFASIAFLGGYPFWGGLCLSGKGISAMLMIFSLLEFCVTCTTAHFSSQSP